MASSEDVESPERSKRKRRRVVSVWKSERREEKRIGESGVELGWRERAREGRKKNSRSKRQINLSVGEVGDEEEVGDVCRGMKHTKEGLRVSVGRRKVLTRRIKGKADGGDERRKDEKRNIPLAPPAYVVGMVTHSPSSEEGIEELETESETTTRKEDEGSLEKEEGSKATGHELLVDTLAETFDVGGVDKEFTERTRPKEERSAKETRGREKRGNKKTKETDLQYSESMSRVSVRPKTSRSE